MTASETLAVGRRQWLIAINFHAQYNPEIARFIFRLKFSYNNCRVAYTI